MEVSDQLLILLLLIFLSAFFSGTETAFVSLSDIKIQHLIDLKRRGINLVKKLMNNRQRLIITILIGNNLVNIAASSIATSLAIEIIKSNAIGIAIGIMTCIILVFGEIIPKNIAMHRNEIIAITAAPVLKIMQFIFFPAIIIFEWLTNFISRPLEKNQNEPIITEDEIKTVVNIGEEIGEIEQYEKIMIHNIFRFNDLHVNEIMTDRTKIFSINASDNVKDILNEIVSQGFSRIPVYDENKDNIIGILYAKDILQATVESKNNLNVKDLVRTAMIVPETMVIDKLLSEFKKNKVHIAMVVDEHGGISGLITIEDLLEEIVGDIYDETDKEKIMIKKVNENLSLVKGETEIEDVNRELNLDLNEKGDYETISGLILSELRYIPEAGEEIDLENCKIKIKKANTRRIIEVEIETAKSDNIELK